MHWVQERRYRNYYISEIFAMDMLRMGFGQDPGYCKLPVFTSDSIIPDDVRVCKVDYDNSRLGWVITLMHESFDPVIPGYEIPVSGVVEYRLVDFSLTDKQEVNHV